MLNWILQLVFDESNAVFIDNGQDLQVQETKLVYGVSKVSHSGVQSQKSQAKSFS